MEHGNRENGIGKRDRDIVYNTHACRVKWMYLMRTIPNLHDLLLPLEEAICQHLIPALTGLASCSTAERNLLTLPVRLRGLGLANPVTSSSPSFQASELLTKALVELIQSQETNQTVDPESTSSIKKSIRRLNRLRHIQQADSVQNHLTPELKCCVELAKGFLLAISLASIKGCVPSY